MSSPRLDPWLIPKPPARPGSPRSGRGWRVSRSRPESVGGVAHGPIAEVDFLRPQRPASRDRTRHRRAIAVGSDHRELDRGQRSRARRNACRPAASIPSSLVSRTRTGRMLWARGGPRARRHPPRGASGPTRRTAAARRVNNTARAAASPMRLRPFVHRNSTVVVRYRQSNIRPDPDHRPDSRRPAPVARVPDPDQIEPVRGRRLPASERPRHLSSPSNSPTDRLPCDLEHRPDQHPVHGRMNARPRSRTRAGPGRPPSASGAAARRARSGRVGLGRRERREVWVADQRPQRTPQARRGRSARPVQRTVVSCRRREGRASTGSSRRGWWRRGGRRTPARPPRTRSRRHRRAAAR